MKVKWIVITKSTQDKKFHCFDEVYDSKKQAKQAIKESTRRTLTSYLHNWKKTKIFPIRWDSVENRSPQALAPGLRCLSVSLVKV